MWMKTGHSKNIFKLIYIMEKYIVVLFWILVLAVILMSVPTKCISKSEGFHNFFNYNKRYCPSCGTKSSASCGDCQNCGVCTTNTGYSECVAGNYNGPTFRRDCAYWEYGIPYNYFPDNRSYPTIITSHKYPYNVYDNLRQY